MSAKKIVGWIMFLVPMTLLASVIVAVLIVFEYVRYAALIVVLIYVGNFLIEKGMEWITE